MVFKKKAAGPSTCRKSLRNYGEPSRARTCDPLIKSQLLYQLSYRPTTEVRIIRRHAAESSERLEWVVSYFGFVLVDARGRTIHEVRRSRTNKTFLSCNFVDRLSCQENL